MPKPATSGNHTVPALNPMQAIVFDQFGEPDEVLGLRDVADPVPDQGEVLVRMLASPVNPSDLMTVRGMYGRLPQLPATPGYEGVGVVESSGGGLLGKYFVGKRVAVLNKKSGNWCEKTVIPAKQAIPVPRTLPLEQAAMFFVNPATAYLMTREVLSVPRGAWLLQTAAGSAVGRMVIRLGKRYGFSTINVVRREAQAEELKAEGADAVVHFDPNEHDAKTLHDAIKEITDGAGVLYAIDPVGGTTATAVAGCMGKAGRLLVYGTMTTEPMSISPRHMIGQGSSIQGFWLTNYMDDLGLFGKIKLVRKLGKLIGEEVLSSEVSDRFPLQNIADAVRESEAVARGGKVLLEIGAP